MRLDTPLLRRLARRLGRPAPLLTLAILLASPAVLARQGTTAEDLARLAAIAAAMETVPLRIGNWVGSEVPIPTDQEEILNPNAILSRKYQEVRSARDLGSRGIGTDVTMLLVHCSDVRDMDGHWPLHCYPKSGWKIEEFRDDIAVGAPGGGTHRFAWARFTIANNNATLRTMTVLFTFVLPEGRVETNMRQLSGGMKRRVLVAQALVHRPPVIVLDEPTAGVDVELRQTLWRFIARLNREGHTVLLTTHYLEEAEALCGRIAMLKQGRIVALDRTSALLAGTASTMLRFKTDDVLPPALAAQARVTGRIAQLKAHDAAEVESHLAALRAAGVRVEDLEIGRADLEDVFVEIMSGARAGVA